MDSAFSRGGKYSGELGHEDEGDKTPPNSIKIYMSHFQDYISISSLMLFYI